MKEQLKIDHDLTLIDNNAGLDFKGEFNAYIYAYGKRAISNEANVELDELEDQLFKLC